MGPSVVLCRCWPRLGASYLVGDLQSRPGQWKTHCHYRHDVWCGRQYCATPDGTFSNGFSTGRSVVTGATVGIGFEYAFPGNWSAKAELDYTGFPGRTSSSPSAAFYNGALQFGSPNVQTTTGLVQLRIGLELPFRRDFNSFLLRLDRTQATMRGKRRRSAGRSTQSACAVESHKQNRSGVMSRRIAAKDEQHIAPLPRPDGLGLISDDHAATVHLGRPRRDPTPPAISNESGLGRSYSLLA